MKSLFKFLTPTTLILGGAILLPISPAIAAPQLTITPITWNILGLDSNNVNVGPNVYMVGARVCNVGSTDATNVTATFVRDGATNSYINLQGNSTLTLASLPAASTSAANTRPPTYYGTIPNNCTDFYYNVEVTRNSAAYNATQLYHIEATADGAGIVSTPSNRELYVEKLVSQNRNAVLTFSGATNVVVGGVYTYTVTGKTATGGYEQLVFSPNFPNTMFQVLNVSATYTTPSGATNNSVYADACGWTNDISSSTYHNNLECTEASIPDGYTGAKAGNQISTTYTVKVIAPGSATVSNVVYDFSGSSYHYNSDFGSGVNVLNITATNPADLTMNKSDGNANFTVGQNGSYTLTATNTGAAPTSGTITITDTLPPELEYISATGTGWTCSYDSPTRKVTCTSTTSIAANSSSNPITLTVKPSSGGGTTITNTANIAGGGETNTSNNTSSDTTTIVAASFPDLTITKSDNNNNFTAGSTGNYAITVNNTGTAATSGIITVTDTLPTGLSIPDGTVTLTGANAADWTCSASSNTITCTTNTAIAASGNSSFSFNVNVAGNAPSSITNTASVSGGNEPAANNGNNTGSDTTTITSASTTTISGTLYEDTDGEDDFDNGETTLPANITVKLLDSNNNVVATTTTAANGTYTFTNVSNGNYKIQVDTSDTDIPSGYTLGTTNDIAVTVNGINASNINFGFDSPPPTGNPYCQSPYNEVYSGQSGNAIFAVHGPTGATMQLTGSALAGTVNSVATDHNNHLVYYAEGTSVYAWDAINNTHITITNNIRSFNSSLPTNSTLLSAGGAAFYNGSLYLGVDPPQAGVFEIYKVNFVSGSNGRTIQSVTPLNINGAGKANGQLNNGDWGDMIIDDNGVIYGSSGGTAKYWSYNLNTSTFTDLVDNIPESSQLAKDGTGRLWAFRNGTSSVVQIQIVGNAVQTVGTASSTSPHSSADGAECVTGLSSIGDRIWDDTDGDGVQDSGEGGFANVTVALYRDIDGDGVIDATDPQLDIQTTDANGNYDFTGLIFGNYIVKVTDTNQVLTGKTITTGTNTKAVNLPTGIQDYNNADFGFNQPIPSNPNVLLVKRITAINGSSFTDLIDGVNDSNSPNYVPTPRDTDDNNANWPSNYLQGLINGGTVRPDDEIEYTIYFLSAGDATAPKVLMCDRVPSNVTFLPTAFNSFASKNSDGLEKADRGIIWQYSGNTESLTNTKDGDVAQYFPPGEDPTDVYPTIDCGGENTNGAVVVNLGNLPNATAPGTPNDSYGFIRFRGRVK
jgi:uncharacterized repeat protein (TIGR01451 family)/fimbrial isopeptide formation D2 family protein